MLGDGYQEFLAKMMKQFSADAGECVEQVQKFIHDGDDMEEVAKTAHGLKGISGNVGAEQLQTLALALEQHCRNGSVQDAMALAPQIQTEFIKVQQAFQRELGQ